MILDTIVNIKPTGKLCSYFKEKGYSNVSPKSELIVYVKDLPITSHLYVNVSCDSCRNESKTQYRRCFDGYICNKCSVKKSNFKKLGVENPFQSERIKGKIKKTLMYKYGVDHPMKSDVIKSKSIKTNLKNLGFENPFQCEDIKEKIKKTSLKNYGFEHPMQSELVKDRLKKSNLEKYGFEHPMQFDEIKKKSLENRKEYIIDNIFKSHKDLIEVDFEKKIYTLKCDNNESHNYQISQSLLNNRKSTNTMLCTKCNKINDNSSGVENKVCQFLDSLSIRYEKNVKNLIKGELDIYIPEKNIAIEFNGLYWHSDKFKDKNYHLDKTEQCSKIGIHLIHIWEDDWSFKNKIVKSILKSSLSITDKIIYSRKCIVKEINNNELVRNFLNNNHLQGYIGSKVKIGLFYNEELVSIMVFGKCRVSLGNYDPDNESYELLRYCNKLDNIVIGGADKIFKYFIRNFKFNYIISYSDKSYFKGYIYTKLGFDKVEDTRPNYYYVVGKKRYHRYSFRKDVLVKKGFDDRLSEKEITESLGINRIYNSGNMKFIYRNF